MSKYTVDLYSLLKDSNFKLFNFEYDFYSDDLNIKQSFETKFIDKYLFNEIGFETVIRFKHYLKQRLNNITPYYKQLYETEVRSKGLDFMLNKDLTETFERDLSQNKIGSINSNMLNNSAVTSTSSDNAIVGFKESAIDNGVASLDLLEGSVTTVNKSDSNNSNNTNSNSNDESIMSSDNNENNTQKEITKLISQGNIGVTSSAELLEKWRRVLINIDNLIIEECKDLFMHVY